MEIIHHEACPELVEWDAKNTKEEKIMILAFFAVHPERSRRVPYKL
jgi:hypothetical protein